jgi:hypothetical protein
MWHIQNVYLQDVEVLRCKLNERKEESTADDISTAYNVPHMDEEKKPLRTER